jgi:nucleotide-binding universal stress UspA family protein
MDEGDRRIIVGVSGSLGSLAALRFGVDQARRTTGAMDAVLAWSPPGGEASPRSDLPPLVQVWTEQAAQRLHRGFCEALGGVPGDLDVRLHVRRGRPGPVLVGHADRASDLLVIGASTAGAVRRLLLGSVGSYCATRSRCALVLAPQPSLAHELRPRWHRLTRNWVAGVAE